jgi:hypothetical protein
MGEFIHTDRKIIICDKCMGVGEDSWQEENKIMFKTCDKCKGSGRLIEIKKWETIYEPYEPYKNVNKNLRRKLSDEK